jgi:pimeloyl-ACP methyl ester carboxylesterase
VRLAIALALLICSVAHAKPDTPKARWEQLPDVPAMPAASDHGDVDAHGASLYYAWYGKARADAPVVILLHGGLGNSDHWANQLPALVDKFAVLVIDSRGQGRSTHTKATLTYDLMAADVIDVMDALKVERASIVGWSDGAEIALKLGIAHADRVDKLFVFAANYDENGSKPRGSRTATFQAYAQRCKADYERLTPKPHDWDAYVDAVLPLYRAPMGFTKDQLRGIQAPVLMADGDHDEVIQLDQVTEMSNLIPHAKLVVFHDASHFALWQDPQAFNQALVEFLTGK